LDPGIDDGDGDLASAIDFPSFGGLDVRSRLASRIAAFEGADGLADVMKAPLVDEKRVAGFDRGQAEDRIGLRVEDIGAVAEEADGLLDLLSGPEVEPVDFAPRQAARRPGPQAPDELEVAGRRGRRPELDQDLPLDPGRRP
jgi:hypothetical protein